MGIIDWKSSWPLALCLGAWVVAAAPVRADSGAHAHEHGTAPQQKSWGVAAPAAKATRTFEVAMSDDMRFTPDRFEIRQGDVVKFAIRNNGRLPHEMVIGTDRELKQHAAEMAKMPGMGHVDPGAVRVEPGANGELVWKFNRAGSFRFACLVPGHLEAGMAGTVVVAPAQTAKGKS
jgi:uncharacterized cupredoxin-like copper-binding protein